MKGIIKIIGIIIFLILIVVIMKWSCAVKREAEIIKPQASPVNAVATVNEVQKVPTEEQKQHIFKYAISNENNQEKQNYFNAFAMKTDSYGNVIWTTACPSENYSWGEFIMQDSAGNFVMLSEEYNYDNGLNFKIIKIDSSGNTKEAEKFEDSVFKTGNPLLVAGDGSRVNASMAYDDKGNGRFSMTCTDKNGNDKWNSFYGIDFYDWGEINIFSGDGGRAVIGYLDNYNPFDGKVYLVKKNIKGSTDWVRTFGGNAYDWAYSLAETEDGGYIIGGISYSFGAGEDDAYIIKTDAKGDCIWAKTYGGTGFDEAYSVIQDKNGYIFAGTTTSFGPGNYQAWIVSLDKNGNINWQKVYPGEADQAIYCISKTQDGGYIMAGVNNYNRDKKSIR